MKHLTTQILKSDSSLETLNFISRTEIKRRWSTFDAFSKWKVFIDGEFMGYIANGETKVFDKQGEVFVDMGYFHEDGSIKWWVKKFISEQGIDTAPSTRVFHKFSELYYLECGIDLKKFIFKVLLQNTHDNYCKLKLKTKNLELQPLFGWF